MAETREHNEASASAKSFVTWLAAIMLLLDLLVVAVALVSVWQSRIQYVERAVLQSQNLAHALVSGMTGMIDTFDVALLSLVDEAERAVARGSIDDASIEEYIAKQYRRLPLLDSMRLANAKGEIIHGIGVVPGGRKSVANRAYFKQLRDDPKAGLVFSEPVIGIISGKKVIIAARRINNPDGSFAGVAYASLTLEKILNILSSLDVGPNGAIALRDDKVRLILRHQAKNNSVSEADRIAVTSELHRRIAAGQSSGTFTARISRDHLPKTISYRKVGPYPFNVVVGLASEDYLAPWRRDLYRMAGLVALFVVVTVILSRLIFARWRQQKQAEDQLRRSREELKLRVAERTGELSWANQRLMQELAERERAEERVRQGRKTLAQVIDCIPQSVFWKDRNSVYLGCNIVFARRAGKDTADGVVGKTDYELPWLREESDAYRKDDREVMEQRRPKFHIIEQQMQADGSRVWVDTTKIPLFDDQGEVSGVLGVYDDITERKSVEESRDKALSLFQSLLASSPAGIQLFDGQSGNCVIANEAVAEMVGATTEQLLAQNFRKIRSWQECGLCAMAEEVLADSVTRRVEKTLKTTFGRSVCLDLFLSRLDVDGRSHLMAITVDLTETKRLEEENKRIEAQMLHVQKLESLGVLAGGIAHDFNNILMVVIGNADLALARLEPRTPLWNNVMQIEQAANRAADLARQMLAYSGKGRFIIEQLDLSAIVREMGQMLEVSISKKVALRYDFAPGLPLISGDATQLRQVILNLVMNASEAIGDSSGEIFISTSSIFCEREYLSESWVDDQLPEGKYVVVEVVDNGCGMDDEVLRKIFDPFFTTKFTGRGLGMAAVLGIVRGHKGAIKVESRKGEGTTFTVLLPAVAEGSAAEQGAPADDAPLEAKGTVLLVDDEECVLDVGKEMLEALGFEVLTASGGKEAIEVFQRRSSEIVCVLLDLAMPGLDGEQTFRALRLIDGDAKVVICSGYNERDVSRKFGADERIAFIQKPFTVSDMSSKLREVLA